MSKMNQKAVKTLTKLIDSGFDTEKAIAAMQVDDMLSLPGISVQELAMVNEIIKAVKVNKIIGFLSGAEKESEKNGEI